MYYQFNCIVVMNSFYLRLNYTSMPLIFYYPQMIEMKYLWSRPLLYLKLFWTLWF